MAQVLTRFNIVTPCHTSCLKELPFGLVPDFWFQAGWHARVGERQAEPGHVGRRRHGTSKGSVVFLYGWTPPWGQLPSADLPRCSGDGKSLTSFPDSLC